MDLHERLQQMLDNYGWSLYKLSKECGLAESTLSNIMSNRTNPSLATLEAICKAFDITLSQFFADETLTELTEEQKELFSKWVSLTPRQKAAVEFVIETFHANS